MAIGDFRRSANSVVGLEFLLDLFRIAGVVEQQAAQMVVAFDAEQLGEIHGESPSGWTYDGGQGLDPHFAALGQGDGNPAFGARFQEFIRFQKESAHAEIDDLRLEGRPVTNQNLGSSIEGDAAEEAGVGDHLELQGGKKWMEPQGSALESIRGTACQAVKLRGDGCKRSMMSWR